MTVILGALIYRERIALVPGGTATIRLRVLSAGACAGSVMAETTIELNDQQVPIPFELSIESAPSPGASYALTATISGPENMLEWTTRTAHSIDLDQDRIEVGSLVLVRTARDQLDPIPGSPLIGEWMVTAINTDPVLPNASTTMTFETDGALVGNAGCNSYSTTYAADASGLWIGSAIATTLMACEPATDQQERAFLEVLNAIAADDGGSRFEINDTGDRLTITSSDGCTLHASCWPKRRTAQ